MPNPSKDFTPIRDDFEFFATHSTESEYRPRRLRRNVSGRSHPPAGPIRMLDFGCSPQAQFTGRFLERARLGGQAAWTWHMVEPSAGLSPAGRRAARGP